MTFKGLIALYTLLSLSLSYAQVLDVNGDQTVGAEEALAVAESWKGTPATPNAHEHLGQNWNGDKNPLSIRGNFPDQNVIIIGPSGAKGGPIPKAPLILDNTADFGKASDLLLGGRYGEIAALEETNSVITLTANEEIFFHPNAGGHHPSGAIVVVNNNSTSVASISDQGNMRLLGDLTVDGLIHGTLATKKTPDGSGEVSTCSGNVVLEEKGEAWVNLPESYPTTLEDFRYHLTCVGSFAPVYVAEEVHDGGFRIAGGAAGQKISWQVTGIVSD